MKKLCSICGLMICMFVSTQVIAQTSGPRRIVLPALTTYAVMDGGNYCEGGFGANVILSGSDMGVNYQLYIDSMAIGLPLPGTGTLLNFGPQTIPGGCTIMGTNTTTGCSSSMSGFVTLFMNPLPNKAYPIAGMTTVEENDIISFSTGMIPNAISYVWGVPNEAVILSGQGTTMITVQFVSSYSGNVYVHGMNICGAGQPAQLAITVNSKKH
jgi:hypothetical protein